MPQPITVYGTATCPQCQAAKKYLESKGLSFEYLDVLKNEEARETLEKLNALSLPVITKGDLVVSGFNVKKMEELFND